MDQISPNQELSDQDRTGVIEHLFEMKRTPLFMELREKIVNEAKREDVLVLVAWLLSNFTDEGAIRSPSAARRKTIVLDGATYWLVGRPDKKS